ncbi:MAG: terminase large subunit domain-containing protein [Candidatus Kapaibacteriales bacterium]
MAERHFSRLIVNLPPRHGKSELITKFFIFWYIGNFPSHRVILVTYQNKFAEEWGRRLRQLIIDFGKKIFNIEIDPKESSARQIRINKSGGKIYCVGSCGPLTGRGAELIIIDDPIKNDREALSPKMHDNLWYWFKATLLLVWNRMVFLFL